jgi:hypothetical protein
LDNSLSTMPTGDACGGSYMILADTSVWIDYFREGLPELAERLRRSI